MEKKRSLSLRRSKKDQGQKTLAFSHRGDEKQAGPACSDPEPSQCAGEEQEDATSPSSWLSGLCNLGNTCYANSILQVLRFCPQLSMKVTILSKLLLQQHTTSCMEAEPDSVGGREDWQLSKGALAIHLHKLWQRMTDKERVSSAKSSVLSAARPQKFLSRLREEHSVFDNKMQQDAQEMLRFLLTSLHETVQLALRSLPDPDQMVDLTLDSSLERLVCASDTTSVGQLTSRKRKLKVRGQDAHKIPKLTGKGASSASKITDFFSPTSALTPNSNSAPEPMAQKPTTRPVQETTKREKVDFVKDMFEGELVSQTRCYECDSLTKRTEPFFDVSLAVSTRSLPGFPCSSTPVKNSGGAHRTASKDLSAAVGPFSLSWAMSQFCLREKLAGDNKYLCEACGHLVEAERSVLFSHLPLVMTLHLNRFEMNCTYGLYAGLSVHKIGGNIAVPLTLCFSTWCSPDCVRREVTYQLFAAVFHTGSSCSSGHYTVCVRGRECRALGSQAAVEWIGDDRNWVEFDDEVVEVLSQQELMDKLSPLTPSTAYILFYSAQC